MERKPSDEQRAVIENLTDNIILYASAGTGKTYTVANRVGNILRGGFASPHEVLCLTFTIKACNEMKEDIARYVGELGKSVSVKTIHGFCYQLMREEDRRLSKIRSEANVCDEVDAEALLRSILSSRYGVWEYGEEGEQQYEFGIYEKRTALRDLVSAIKHARIEYGYYTDDEAADNQKAYFSAKQKNVEIVSYFKKYEGRVRDEAFIAAMDKHAGQLVFEYDSVLKQSNLADFDDLIITARRYLDEREVVARWSKRYKYIVVDEMQDTSVLEYDVLRRIFGKNNVLLCGDFFQTVYGWRGSNPEKVLDAYCKEFCAKTYMFSANYRSTKTLTAATFGYLKNTYPAFMGKYCPASIEAQGEDGGDKIRCFGFDNRKEEAFQIFNYAKKHPQNLCIMARSNKYIAYLYERFEAENRQLPEEERVRFFTVEENHQFYKKSVVKDILAVLRLVSDDTDAISMERLAGRYIGGVGIRTLEKLRSMQPLGVSVVSFLDKRVYNEQDPYRVLIESFQKGEVVVYDTETTGLDVLRDEMVQLSAVRLNGAGEITDALDLMIEPNVEIGKGAYETHGFDLAYIRSHGGVSAKVALEKFSAFCQGAILVGHNSLRFDSPLIKRQLAENGLPPIDVCGEYDTLLLAKRFLPGLSDYKLSTLCKQFGIVNENAHNAFGDIVATGKVLACLLKEYVLPTALERVNAVATYKEKFSKFFAFIQAVKGLVERNDNKALIPYIAESMRLYKRYTNIADWQAIEELKSYFAELATANLSAFLRGYLADASLSGSQMDILVKRTSSIPIVTVHQAKGCEFDTVIVAGADENHFPSFMARETGSEDEERRVFYVALTRAKKKLILTRAVYNGSRVVDPTPYFWQIPQTYTLTNENWLMTKETAGQVFDE